ncbi:MAG TPA: DUF1592 domain-containing protein [Isosphaeraceae bacterium]|nr:DUF1592 domain-containing protein [Isosphaeraceae bacterium]
MSCALAVSAGCGRVGDTPAPAEPAHSVRAVPTDVVVLFTGKTAVTVQPTSRSVLFSRDVAPILARYCMSCHDAIAAEGGVVLDRFSDQVPDLEHATLLLRVAGNLRSESMPPEGEPHPGAAELETLNAWLDAAAPAPKRDAGRVVLRRLNRAEYNNTIRDLVGLDLRPADEFPSDDVGYGFDNIADVLSTPPVLAEMYLAAADNVIATAFGSLEIRQRIMNPPADMVPLVFRQYKPPVRAARENKVLRTGPPAEDPELKREQRIYDVLRAFADRAFRRPARHDELVRLFRIVVAAEKDGESPEMAIQLALGAVLASPHFLFLGIEAQRALGSSATPLPDDDFNLASRLSYFLWSSMPDDELFGLASQGTLRRPETLRAQVVRMLRDPKSRALAETFAPQWLQIRKLKDFTPDPLLFPDFDESLRSAMLEETRLFFAAIQGEDRPVLEFLDADYTFVNERLARHYGMPGIRGEHFRRVSLTGTARGGVLTHASILAATSNPTRTSPVKRGKWILENILGAPPSPPPSGVEALKETPGHKTAGTLRERLERHRRDPSCASCHRPMDPLGFGFENFDAVGSWRTHDGGQTIDASGNLPGGQTFAGPAELRAMLVSRRHAFARCFAEKLLTYALGRGLERTDRRVVEQIVARLEAQRYRFSALVLAVVESAPFLSNPVPQGNP